MPKSSFNLAGLVIALLTGCAALDVPLPSKGGESEIRATLTGFVRPGIEPHIFLSRPDCASDGRSPSWNWFDQPSSQLALEGKDSTGTLLTDSFPTVVAQQRLRDSLSWSGNGRALASDWRLRGRLHWNTAIPIATASSIWTEDSIDFRADSSEVLRLRRDSLEGDISLRWGRLASSTTDQRKAWAQSPDSLARLAREWNSLCRVRKTDSVILWGSHGSEVSGPLDIVRLRLHLLDSLDASVLLAASDTIFPRLYNHTTTLWARLQTPTSLPVLRWSASRQNALGFLKTSTVAWTSATSGAVSEVLFHIGTSTTSPCSPSWTTIQLAGTCAAFRDWQHVNATSRDETPSGNVAPFDGYFCTQTLDTISFPEGDAQTCSYI